MFEFTIQKEQLLALLFTVAGALDKKQSLTILSNFLIRLNDGLLLITATDLEIEISAQAACKSKSNNGSITVPAKKIIDIIRSLDDKSSPNLLINAGLLTIKQGRSSFKLSTLAAEAYPLSVEESNEVELTIPRLVLLKLLQSTHFALSQHDVRIFLNGLFLSFEPNLISAVATDGHRMAVCHYRCANVNQKKLLLPKKAVQELLRLLNTIEDDEVLLAAGKSHFKLVSSRFTFSSKLIEARFPPYNKVIPKNLDKQLIIDCPALRRSLSRVVILAHEKSRAVMLHLQANLLTLIANNNEQEEAIESLVVETQGDELKIGLNATYLLDVLSHFGEEKIRLSFSSGDSSVLIESLKEDNYQYIIMPMKI